MLEFIYKTLASIGFTHPLHPIATHIPMGMIIGGIIFKFASIKWQNLANTAYHCYALALLGVFPTIILGLMDWQYRYHGVLNSLIIAKLVLACVLTAFLALTVYYEYKKTLSQRVIFILYVLCLLPTIGLGFIGGQLIFG